MKITVTNKHILLGMKRSAYECPIALALKDSGLEDPCVGEDSICIESSFEDILLPIEAVSFIKDFDQNLTVKPFSFELEIPNHVGEESF